MVFNRIRSAILMLIINFLILFPVITMLAYLGWDYTLYEAAEQSIKMILAAMILMAIYLVGTYWYWFTGKEL